MRYLQAAKFWKLSQVQGGAVSWNRRRQPTIALSSTEAEHMSQEAKPVMGMFDSNGAIDLTKNANFSLRTKHSTVRHHFVEKKIGSKDIAVEFTASSHMRTDSLTAKLYAFTGRIGLNQFY